MLSWLKNLFSRKIDEQAPPPAQAPGAEVEHFDKQKAFYVAVRKSFGALRQTQVDNMGLLFTEWYLRGDNDIRKLAYIFATIWHETAATFQPIAEYGRGKGRPYGKPDKRTGLIYYGRGYVQLTHFENYKKYGIEKTPERALIPSVASEIALDGMFKGTFTGKKLSDYFNDHITDPINARRIINGTDKAQLIAQHYHHFLFALSTEPVRNQHA